MDQNPIEPTPKRFEVTRRRLTHAGAAVAGGAVVALYFTKYRTTLTCINISPEMVERVKETWEPLMFGTKRNPIVVSLTRNV